MPAALEQSKAMFVRRWGEMAAYWGISRTMAELHALLFASPGPLCTDDIMEQLAISRGNASMNLRSLVDWGLIERVHRRGERREYFVARPDVWGLFESIVRQRKRREVEPIVETIRRCLEIVAREASSLKGESANEARIFRERLNDMLEFLTNLGRLIDVTLSLGPKGLRRINAVVGKLI